jgi:Xaa-Pro aminopeptidase
MKERINKIKNLINEMEIDALLIDSDVNRFYLTAFTGTSGKVLFTPVDSYFITDFRYIEQARDQIEAYKIIEIKGKYEQKIVEILKEDGVKTLAFESNIVTYMQYEEYKREFKEFELIPTENLVAKLRLIKDEDEIKRVKKAVEISDRAFEHILKYIKAGISERDIALELEYFMKKEGGENNSFDFIVASGERSSMPHGVASSKKVEIGDFITMDFGTIYKGYCSDMTRTIVLGKASKKQEEIYNIVLRAQIAVLEKIKAGMKAKEADAIARDIIADTGYGENFGHGLGHGVGIEVHEEPRLSYMSDAILEAGMIVTDEPGIYIPDWGGVRIEEDLIITEDGCELLNSSSKELIVL